MDKEEKNNWYKPEISATLLKEISRKSDYKGLMRLGSYFFILLLCGYIAFLSINTVYVVPCFLLYGIVFGFLNAAHHELMHKSVFKSTWLNKTGLWMTSLLLGHEQIYNYYSHLQHHNFTMIEGKDIEGRPFHRPPQILTDPIDHLIKYRDSYHYSKSILFHSFGTITENAQFFVPKTKYNEMRMNAKIHLLFNCSIIVSSVILSTWLPLLLVMFPRYYGGLLHNFCSATQHTGLASNVKDHRLNSRTILIGPVLRFLYFNMNYHIEHHLYLTVPFYSLKILHLEIKNQLPKPASSLKDAWIEIIDCLKIQMKNPDYFIQPVIKEIRG